MRIELALQSSFFCHRLTHVAQIGALDKRAGATLVQCFAIFPLVPVLDERAGSAFRRFAHLSLVVVLNECAGRGGGRGPANDQSNAHQ